MADERERAKVRLRKALVRFSEKVLFIANNDKLLSDDREKINRYILVLQAVGNSILIQADELRNRAEFDRDLEYRESPEIWAQEQGAKEWPDQPYRAWLKDVKLDGAAGTGNRSQREVLDDLIALLRYEYITVVKTNGKTSTEAKKTLDALAVAYEQRAGMAYIRPTGAYLRSSYPATSLQDDPRLGWRNMLSDHGLRTTPIIGSLYNLATEDRTKAEINAEIDKQFWQTINSVRVAGAGRTNYVIVKDDIGNWYVKKYSADPESIIKSATSLALFGMGGQFDPDLAAQALQKDGLSDPDKLARQPKPAAPALQPAFNQQKESYAKATGDLYEALRTLLKEPQSSELKQTINQSWQKNLPTMDFKTELATALELAVGEALQSVSEGLGAIKPEDDPSGVVRAKKILDALTGINGFQGTLRSKVLNLKLVAIAENELELLEEKKTGAETEFKEAESNREKAEKADPGDDSAIAKLTEIEKKKAMALQTATTNVEDAKAKVKKVQLAQDAAVSDAAQIVRDLLSVRIDKRLRAVNSYEAGIIVLGGIKTQ